MKTVTEGEHPSLVDSVEKESISPEHYQEALERLELQSLALDNMSAWCDRDKLVPGETKIVISGEASEATIEEQYLVFMKYNIKGIREEESVFEFNADYRLTFSCENPVPDGFFEVYQGLNLQITTLPYFREFVSSVTSRLDIPTFTLPYSIFAAEQSQPIQAAEESSPLDS